MELIKTSFLAGDHWPMIARNWAVLAGYVFAHAFISDGAGEFWKGSVAFSEELIHHMHGVPWQVKWAPFAVMITGLFFLVVDQALSFAVRMLLGVRG